MSYYVGIDLHSDNNIYPKEIRPVRDFLRKRTMLVMHRLVLVKTGNGACVELAKHDPS